MSLNDSPGGKIHLLPPGISNKIAAGEVIERPQALVRELLDNSIDAGADSIEVFLQDGGNEALIVQDNGCGMSQADLKLCWLAHSTSKIRTEADLRNIQTLGFRGEALSSIAQVSRLVIFTNDGNEGGKLVLSQGLEESLEPWAGAHGSRFEVHQLFFNLPARRQFLKRGASEGLLCKQTFIEKALAHPHCTFRLYKENKLDLFLGARGSQNYFDRFLDLNTDINKAFLFQIKHQEKDFSFSLIACTPEVYRHDKRGLQIFVNSRKIYDYGLSQALEYAYEGYLPGGRYPVAALFLQVNPFFLDVNIHPAKKEVKLLNYKEIHHAIVQQLSNNLRLNHHAVKNLELNLEKQQALDLTFIQSKAPEKSHPLDLNVITPRISEAEEKKEPREALELYERRQNYVFSKPVSENKIQKNPEITTASPVREEQAISENATLASSPFKYFGQCFGIFLIFEIKDQLRLMDIHAAHERILYDQYRQAFPIQQLLIPYIHDLEDVSATSTENLLDILEKTGFIVEIAENKLVISGIPSIPHLETDRILASLKEALGSVRSFQKEFFADLACKKAIKDGEILEASQACELIRRALALPEPRCPHGRPIFVNLDKKDLWTAIGREV